MIVKTRYCDRCGIEIPDNEFWKRGVGDLVLHRMNSDKNYNPLDLCADCYSELNEWMISYSRLDDRDM